MSSMKNRSILTTSGCNLTHRFMLDVVDEESIDLDDIGLQPHPQVHARIGRPVIVERELNPGLAQGADGRDEAGHVGDLALLRQFEDHPIDPQAMLVQPGDGTIARLAQRDERFGAEIEEQFAFAPEAREGRDARARGGMFERHRQSLPSRLREQRPGRFERRSRRAANQPFVTENGAAVEIDDRLENGGKRSPSNQLGNVRVAERRKQAQRHDGTTSRNGWTFGLSTAVLES